MKFFDLKQVVNCKMTKVFIFFMFLLFQVSLLFAQDNLSALIPLPNKIIQKDSQKKIKITKDTYIALSSDSLRFEAQYLQEIFRKFMGVVLPIKKSSSAKGNAIKLEIHPSMKGALCARCF